MLLCAVGTVKTHVADARLFHSGSSASLEVASYVYQAMRQVDSSHMLPQLIWGLTICESQMNALSLSSHIGEADRPVLSRLLMIAMVRWLRETPCTSMPRACAGLFCATLANADALD